MVSGWAIYGVGTWLLVARRHGWSAAGTLARGVLRKHCSARDRVSRWDVLYVAERATAASALELLDALLERMPFPLCALQVDGGSEFAAEFEQAC
jgi:hypothetical protein